MNRSLQNVFDLFDNNEVMSVIINPQRPLLVESNGSWVSHRSITVGLDDFDSLKRNLFGLEPVSSVQSQLTRTCFLNDTNLEVTFFDQPNRFMVFEKISKTSSYMELPRSFIDWVNLENGIVGVAHNTKRPPFEMLSQIVKAKIESGKSILTNLPELKSFTGESSQVQAFEKPLDNLGWAKVGRHFDVILVDGFTADRTFYSRCVHLANSCTQVFVLSQTKCIQHFLLDVFHKLSLENMIYLRPLFVDAFKGAIGVKDFYSKDNKIDYLYELLLNTPKVALRLNDGDIMELDHLQAESSEQTGMCSYNQSILANYIKRKIDVKEAFRMSPNPEELDVMMKRVGL